MKRSFFTALFALCLVLLLLPTSAEASSYTLTEVHKKDTVYRGKLTDVNTGTLIPFNYEVPEDGAAVIYFYKTSCGNCQYTFSTLNDQPWVRNDRVNFYAIESTEHGIEDIRTFQAEQCPDITDAITWLDTGTSNLCSRYLYAAGQDGSGWLWPAVVVITKEDGVNTIRAASDGATDVRRLGNTLELLLNEDLGVPKPVPLTISVTEDYDKAAEMIKLVNQHRKEQGLPTLQANETLTDLAMLRAAELQIFFSQSRPDGTSIYDYIKENYSKVDDAHEIIGYYLYSPQEFLNAILDDPWEASYLNMDHYTQIGVGYTNVNGSPRWVLLTSDDGIGLSAATQTGRTDKAVTVKSYTSCLDAPGLSPTETILYPGNSDELRLYGNAKYAILPLIPTACDSEIKDSSGQTIATAALQADGTVLVTASAVGTGELRVYGWEGQEEPYTSKITVSDAPEYRSNKLYTTVKGSGQVQLSQDTAQEGERVDLTIVPDQGWWPAALYVKTAEGENVPCYALSETEYMFYMPQADVDITAEFLSDSVPQTRYSIGEIIAGNGEIFIHSGAYTAYADTTVTATATGHNGHVLKSLTVTDADGNPIDVTANTDGSYSFQMPAVDVVIYAVFAPAEGYAITVVDSFRCTVTPNSANADPGETVTVTIIPDEGYELRDYYINLWNDDSTLTDKNTLTFTMPDFDVELSVYCIRSKATAGSFGDGLQWKMENGTLTISGDGSMGENESTWNVPWNECRDEIQAIVIEEGVTDIFNMAFAYMANLNTVTIPASVEYIDSWAFLNAEALTDINFSGSAPSLGMEGSAFANVSAFVNVPANDRSWTAEVTQDYGGSLMWNHSWSSEVTEPTCTEEGYTTYTCTCGDTQQDNFTAPLGHDYTDGLCTRCGEADPDHKEPITNPFTDVADTDWFYNPVLWAVENKVTGGMTETTFGPNANCTRAQVVTFLYAAAGKPQVSGDTEPFEDVSESDWFYTPVLWAVENGITGGTSETTFGPNEECTRAQVVTFLYAAAGKPQVSAGSDFTDVGDTDWYAKPVIWAKENNITGGISATEFGPNNICTRAQVVTFLYKASLVK